MGNSGERRLRTRGGPYGQFHRGFRLGVPVQHDRVEAAYRDGVLTVTLPKAETTNPRKVAVNAN